MHALIDEGLLETMSTESFGDRLRLLYGVSSYALLTKEDQAWQSLMLRLLQEYSFQKATKSASYAKESPYGALFLNNKEKKKK